VAAITGVVYGVVRLKAWPKDCTKDIMTCPAALSYFLVYSTGILVILGALWAVIAAVVP
jgi:hypothetical protein